MKKLFTRILPGIGGMVFFCCFIPGTLNCQVKQGQYHSPDQVTAIIKELQAKYPDAIKLHTLGTSPGKQEVWLVEIGSEIKTDQKTLPAVLVVANMEGTTPLGTEGALYLAEQLASHPERYKNLSWYIVLEGNPDAAIRYFTKPLYKDGRNSLPVNDDKDELTDEDGYNDLDGNGVITMMRVKDPEGEWIPLASDSRLMKKADPDKGEKGMYKLYSEGTDDDGDGNYNEDGIGGVNVGLNFPHLFKYFNPESGLYPSSAPETFALMQFVFSHPEIAMSFAFGSSNFCMDLPGSDRKGSVDMDKITIPEEIAKDMGFEPSRTYSMKEIMEKVKTLVPPGMEIDEGMVASFLGLGATVNPLREDLDFYKKLNDDYAEFLKKKGYKGERFESQDAKDGSFELWSYYQLGLPVFSMDLWGIPKPEEKKTGSSGITTDSLARMTKEDFLALGEQKITDFLKDIAAPPGYKAKILMETVRSGEMTPRQMADMIKQMPKPPSDDNAGDGKEKALLAFYDNLNDSTAFVRWHSYKHPTLGEIEIGGFVPFKDNTPPAFLVDSLLSLQVPWIFELANRLPQLKFGETKITPKGPGIYQLEVWINNERFLPFPTAMGKKDAQPAPAIITLDGKGLTFLSGRQRSVVKSVAGLKNTKVTWLIEAEKGTVIKLNLSSKTAGNDVKQIKLEDQP